MFLFRAVISCVCMLVYQYSPEKPERPHRYVLFGPESCGGMSADSPIQTQRGGAAALLFAKSQTVKWYLRVYLSTTLQKTLMWSLSIPQGKSRSKFSL